MHAADRTAQTFIQYLPAALRTITHVLLLLFPVPAKAGANVLPEISDNDQLSAMVAEIIQADLLILLTDIDALYDKDPCATVWL